MSSPPYFNYMCQCRTHLQSFIESMDNADEDVIKLTPESIINFPMASCAEASWVRHNVDIDELEGVRPNVGIIESLGPCIYLMQRVVLVTPWVSTWCFL